MLGEREVLRSTYEGRGRGAPNRCRQRNLVGESGRLTQGEHSACRGFYNIFLSYRSWHGLPSYVRLLYAGTLDFDITVAAYLSVWGHLDIFTYNRDQIYEGTNLTDVVLVASTFFCSPIFVNEQYSRPNFNFIYGFNKSVVRNS